MIPIHPDLLSVLDAVEIRTSTRFELRGRSRDIAAAGQDPVSALRDEIYQYLYTRPVAPHVAPAFDANARRELIAALSAANCGRGSWEPGWVVKSVDDEGRVAVSKDDLTAWASLEDLRVEGPEVRAGRACRVRVGKESRNRMAGFYIAIGDSISPECDGGRAGSIVRYYWHLTAEAAVPFMEAATGLLNAVAVPFTLKVLADPDAYRRADAGVLYLHRDVERQVGDTIARIHQSIAPSLRGDVPLFTRPLARGLAVAENPVSALSFGEHRCKLVAMSLWNSFLGGESGRDARAAALASAFRDEGLNPMSPHLGPGSDYDYVLRPIGDEPDPRGRSFVSRPCSRPAPSRDRTMSGPCSPKEAAVLIGRALCRRATWDVEGRLCNWMGRPSSLDTGQAGPTSAALGPDLYAGSSGIALFLAELHAMTGDEEFRRTSLGAIHRSILQLARRPSSGLDSPLSLFLGELGVAYVAWRVGALIGRDAVAIPTRALLDRVAAAVAGPHPLDVLGGGAGAIPALLSLARTPGLEPCRKLAIELGEDLCRRARRDAEACSWEPDSATGPRSAAKPLTGLAHGATGISLALFELHAATGRDEFLETARGGFAYEDALFEAQEGNRPDLRHSGIAGSSRDRPGFASAWCHGAPGIALSRLRAAMLDPVRSDVYLASARIAIATTLDAIDRQFEYPRADATPCHGLAGLLEVVLIAGRLLGDPVYQARAASLGRALIDRHAASGDWPSGVPSGGPNPSLMLGDAGIGYHLLRLHDPEGVPSILWLEQQREGGGE